MCRFVAYLGTPVLAEELLTRPSNSLIHQSHHALETAEPLNGDGFGLGWYTHSLRPEPGLFRSITPAWNNQNLKYNAGVIQSNCILAHVRAATEGVVSELNSHPFHYRQYLMMHNGGIRRFSLIKRDLINQLSDHYYQWIRGQTDSEHIFALFMQNVSQLSGEKQGTDLPLPFLAECFKKTFSDLEQLKQARDLNEASVYNMVITDGRRMLVTRFSTNPQEETRTLYLAVGHAYVCDGNTCHMDESGKRQSLLAASEKLDEFVEEWIVVPQCTAVLIDKNLNYSFQSLV